MFRKTEPVRRRGSFLPFTILRLLLSLVILAVFALGVYQAFRYFSGLDPLKISPGALAGSLISSESLGPVAHYLDITLPGGRQPLKGLAEKLPVKEAVIPKEEPPAQPQGELLYKFAVVADSHNDNDHLAGALAQAKEDGAKFVIGLGDWSQVGTAGELNAAKSAFTASGLPFYITAGDHDLWDSRNKGLPALSDFNQVFGPAYQSFIDSNIYYVIVNNSDDTDGLGALQTEWLKQTFQDAGEKSPRAIFLFMHMPLYHPSSDHVMGQGNPSLSAEAGQIINMAKDAGVKAVFAGHVHAFTSYTDPQSGLKMITAGAVTGERNTQNPRFLLVDVYSSGDYNIEDTEIK